MGMGRGSARVGSGALVASRKEWAASIRRVGGTVRYKVSIYWCAQLPQEAVLCGPTYGGDVTALRDGGRSGF
jgi:hypothetical protein